MKIQAEERTETTRPPPDKGRFQQVLQQAAGPQASARAPTPPRPPTAPGLRKPALGGLPPSGRPLQAPRLAVGTGSVPATSRSALASPERLSLARQAMHGEAQRLSTRRSEAQAAAQERIEHRLSELLSHELAREPRPERPASAAAPLTPPLPAEPSRTPVPGELSSSPGEPRAGCTTSGAPRAEAQSAPTQVQAALELIERIEVFVKSQRPALQLSIGGALEATVEVERTGPREIALRIQGRRGPLPIEELTRLREGLQARGLRLRSWNAQ